MKVSHEPIETGFRVRLMSPLGSYPANTFTTKSATLVVTPEICFSIVRVKGEDWSFSEVDSLTPLEIPLLGSILLSVSSGNRYIYPYPTDHELLLETSDKEDINDKCISECRDFLLDNVRENRLRTRPAGQIHWPPALGGIQYELIPSQHSDKERRTTLQKLESASPIILRGIGSLIKAHMAWEHAELGEAACIFLWICLDAAHSVILQKLRETGVVNPTSKDAARYFDKIVGYNTGLEKFFEDDYENRIRALHPDNRFGAEARPQFLADDFYELNEMLIPLFQVLVSASCSDNAKP
jgi:hypothetical protein